MSKKRCKRFYVSESENQLTIYDNEGLDDYYHLGNDERDVKGICKLLNEQQSSINQLKAEKIKLNEENKRLNAFLVHKCFAEEYIRWKREDEQFEENIYTPSKKPMRLVGGKQLFKREYL